MAAAKIVLVRMMQLTPLEKHRIIQLGVSVLRVNMKSLTIRDKI